MFAEKYHYLVFKQLTEGLNAEEAGALKAWLAESAENRQAAAEIEAIFNAAAPDVPPVDLPTELAALKNRLRTESAPDLKAHRTPLTSRRWWWAAAALLVLVVAVFTLRPGSRVAEEWSSVVSDDQINLLVKLPDNSRVWLNHHSEIAYLQQSYGQAERRVRLKGEAFFEVTKNPSQPFVVETDGCQVKVLGTSFNVRARGAEPVVEVAVRTGSVQVSTSTEGVVLRPGQQVVVDKNSRHCAVSEEEKATIAEWRSAEMVFQNQPLEQAAQRISRRFNREIEITNPELLNCRYSGYFPQADLDAILANLQAVFGVRVESEAAGIRLLDGHCPR